VLGVNRQVIGDGGEFKRFGVREFDFSYSAERYSYLLLESTGLAEPIVDLEELDVDEWSLGFSPMEGA
jgi:hypothetical protein